MKLTKKSLTIFILEVIAWFGNLPYSALSLFSKNYESLQDAVQKLIRAGYVAAILTNPGKVLHITREGKAQLSRKLELYGEIPCFAEIQYDPKKALREGRINESRIMFGCAGIEETFHPAHWVRRHLTQKEEHGGDLIKYSRFSGIFKREKACSVVYHFGRKNITWNKNEEDNIATVARDIFGPWGASASDYPVSRLILANKMDSLENIIRFSEKYAAMPKSKRRFINAAGRPFVIKNDWNVSEPYAFFVHSTAGQCLCCSVCRIAHGQNLYIHLSTNLFRNTRSLICLTAGLIHGLTL